MPQARPWTLYLASALVALAPALLAWWPGLDPGWLPPESLPAWSRGLWLGLAAFGALGLYLNQTRLLALSLGLALAWGLLLSAGQNLPGERPLADAYALLSFSLPFGFALSLLAPEGKALGGRSLARLALLLAPSLLLLGLATQEDAEFKRWLAWRAWGEPGKGGLTHLSLLGPLAYAGLLALKRDPKIWPALLTFGASLPGLLSLAAAVGAGRLDAAAAWRLGLLYFLVLCALLLLAVLAMYWQRVYLDELTGVPNRRALDERLQRLSPPYCLAMVDIDHFKKFNDSYGHDEGDNVLRLVAGHLAESTANRTYRYGGEEFCVVLEGVAPDEALNVLDASRAGLEQRPFSIRLPKPIRERTSEHERGSMSQRSAQVKVTVSVGIAATGPKLAGPEAVLKRADESLYKAKENGRNRVEAV